MNMRAYLESDEFRKLMLAFKLNPCDATEDELKSAILNHTKTCMACDEVSRPDYRVKVTRFGKGRLGIYLPKDAIRFFKLTGEEEISIVPASEESGTMKIIRE